MVTAAPARERGFAPATESKWLEWAEHRTVQEVSAGVTGRQKGDLPGDRAHSSIHHATFRIGGRMSVKEKALFDAAKARFEQMQGTQLSEMEFINSMITLAQQVEPDGSMPGWKPTKNAAYRVVIRHAAHTGDTSLSTAEGWVPLDEQSSRDILREAGHEDLANNVPDRFADATNSTRVPAAPEGPIRGHGFHRRPLTAR